MNAVGCDFAKLREGESLEAAAVAPPPTPADRPPGTVPLKKQFSISHFGGSACHGPPERSVGVKGGATAIGMRDCSIFPGDCRAPMTKRRWGRPFTGVLFKWNLGGPCKGFSASPVSPVRSWSHDGARKNKQQKKG